MAIKSALIVVMSMVLLSGFVSQVVRFVDLADTPPVYPAYSSTQGYVPEYKSGKIEWVETPVSGGSYTLPSDVIRNHTAATDFRLGSHWLFRSTPGTGVNLASGHIDLLPVAARGWVRIQDGNNLPGSIEGYDPSGNRKWVIGLLDANERVRIFGDGGAEFAFSNDVFVGSDKVLVESDYIEVSNSFGLDTVAFLRDLELDFSTVSSTSSISASTEMLFADATAADLTINLPAAATWPGKRIRIKRTDNSGNVVTIDASGSEEIDLSTTKDLLGLEAVVLTSDGSSIWIIN